MEYRHSAGHVAALFCVTSFVVVGSIDPRSNTYIRVRDILSLGDISIGGQLSGVLDPLARRIFVSTYGRTTVVSGIGKISFTGFNQSRVSLECGQEKNESNMRDLPQRLRDAIEGSPLLVGERLLPAAVDECPYPLLASSSLVNLMILFPDNGLGGDSPYGTSSFGRGNNYDKLPISIFLSILVATVLVYLGVALIKFILDFFHTRLLPVFESSIEVGVCQELANAVPERLQCDDLVSVNAERPIRLGLVPHLGCVILAPSGPLSIDPRPSRQISEEEDTLKYGLPVEALAYPRTPLGTLASCFAGSRPESPYTPLRKVTFADENDVFILPLVNLTKDRNLRRRNSRRLQTAKAASDDGKNTEVPIAKRRWF